MSIRHAASGEALNLDELVEKLAGANAVFLGESHTDETTHRLQSEIYRRLLEKHENRVVLALEMFERDVQPPLDKYLAAEISEVAFLAQARPWSNYREAYRPLIEEAKQRSAPVVASNFPAELVRRISQEGATALESLSVAERRFVPRQLLPNSEEYWQRVDNAFRGHQVMRGDGQSAEERLYSTQSLWDNAMGEACGDALEKHPEHLVLHINGGFHSAYRDGAVHQLGLRKPRANILTVAIEPALSPATAELRGKPTADYVVYVEARATNIDQGRRSVQVGRELKYILHLPSSASGDTKWPLLIWLPQNGLTVEEESAYRQAQFGGEAAIAVVEPLYRETGWDLSMGGRWYWEDTFAEDVSKALSGIEEIWAYLLRHYPIDAGRVCVAGESAGATVAAVVATQSGRMDHAALAIDPAEYSQLKDVPLLLPEAFGDQPPPARSLKVLAKDGQRDWWDGELGQYGKAAVRSEFVPLTEDPWEAQRRRENAVRSALGLTARPVSTNPQRAYILLEADSARAQHWARLQAAWHTDGTGVPTVAVREMPNIAHAAAVPLSIQPAAAAQNDVIPKCPGPFGGTTVLVLPPHLQQEAVSAWMSLEERDPLAAASRFHRVRIATASGDGALPDVLKTLLRENRKNVLVVPATFYADAAWLHQLRQAVEDLNNRMTIRWQPGLGSRRGILSH